MNKVIELKNVGKQFNRKKDISQTFKSFALGKLLSKQSKDTFWALKDLNFEVNQGETLGIIGSNGAGKSTLLSLLAGTTKATQGSISVIGRISSLLELGAGFHPDLTGRENIFLNASILGMSRAKTIEKYDEIVSFADIGDAIDSPVKYYSSGMYVRLGFSVAVMCDPDVLLMDEILAVGDEAFRKKSLSKIDDFKNQGKTMLIVSHDLETIKKMADRVLLLHNGQIKDLGEPLEVVEHYKNFSVYKDGDVLKKEFGTREVIFKDVKFKSNNKIITETINGGDPLTISITLESKSKVEHLVVGFGISDNLGNILFGTNTQIMNQNISEVNGEKIISIEIPSIVVQRGIYYFSLALHNEEHNRQYHRLDNFFKLNITTNSFSEGILFLPCKIIVE